MNRAEFESQADRLLEIIRAEPGTRFTFDSLSRSLGIPESEVPRLAGQLAVWGYALNVTDTDIRLLATPDTLTATEISWNLGTRIIGRRLLAFSQVRSTNDIASREAETGAPEGTAIVANQQTAGRGRLGRIWHSPPESGAYISIVLRPDIPPDRAPGISLVAALALAEAIDQLCPGKVKVKWPNDVLIEDRKTAGILTELSAVQNKTNHIIVGVGINVNQNEADFPTELRRTATSVRIAAGREISRVKLVQDFFLRLEQEYLVYLDDFLAPSLPRLRRYSALLGKTVRLDTATGRIEGVAVDLDRYGCLVIERDGRRQTISSGDVTVVKDR